MNNLQTPTKTQGIYNFCDLHPAAQTLLFKQILYFDIAANQIAQATDQIVVSVRTGMLTRFTHGCAGENGFTVMYFNLLAEIHSLPKDCFEPLTVDAKHFALLLGNLMIYAIEELQTVLNDDRDTYEIEQALKTDVEREFKGCTAEEIAIYFHRIDSWQYPLPSIPAVFFNTEVA